MHKTTDALADHIVSSYLGGESARGIAARLHISATPVLRVLHGRHVPITTGPAVNTGGRLPTRGAMNTKWKGGRIVHKGYVLLYAPNHPAATRSKPYVREHRLVMEKLLGRLLTSAEHVHHIDHNRSNNEPSNLLVIGLAAHQAMHHSPTPISRLCDWCGKATTRIPSHLYATTYCSRSCAGRGRMAARLKPATT